MNGKRWICLGLAVMMLLTGASCGEQSASETADITQNTTQNITAQAATAVPGALEKPAYVEPGENGSRSDKPLGFQFELPQIGEEIAVLTVKDYGDIRIRLFPEEAPIAVANFKSLINAGYYDGLTFHRVIADFMIQGGDPNGNGTGGQSAWGDDFEDEYNTNLLNYRGALAMANSGPHTNGSQFFINTASTNSFTDKSVVSSYSQRYEQYKTQYQSTFESQYGDQWEDLFNTWYKSNVSSVIFDVEKVSDEIIQMYNEKGGNMYLDGALSALQTGHTVFGQVFEGMEIVDAIQEVEVDSSTSKPTTEIVIEKAQIVTYEG